MTPAPHRSREHTRTVARLVAIAEAYGCTDLDALRDDVDAIIRVEYLVWQRQVRTAQEATRRAVAKLCHCPDDCGATAPQGAGSRP